jgi:hypothetical protein
MRPALGDKNSVPSATTNVPDPISPVYVHWILPRQHPCTNKGGKTGGVVSIIRILKQTYKTYKKNVRVLYFGKRKSCSTNI